MANERRENLKALKELLKDTIKKDAQTVFNFEEKVNEITFEKMGLGMITADGDYVANKIMGNMCNRIIDSRMSMDDKEFILATMSQLLDIAKTGTVLDAMSDEDRQKAVEEAAENFIKKKKHIAEKMFPTGGTTETHKTIVVE